MEWVFFVWGRVSVVPNGFGPDLGYARGGLGISSRDTVLRSGSCSLVLAILQTQELCTLQLHSNTFSLKIKSNPARHDAELSRPDPNAHHAGAAYPARSRGRPPRGRGEQPARGRGGSRQEKKGHPRSGGARGGGSATFTTSDSRYGRLAPWPRHPRPHPPQVAIVNPCHGTWKYGTVERLLRTVQILNRLPQTKQ